MRCNGCAPKSSRYATIYASAWAKNNKKLLSQNSA
jgi:hypothetical protein